MSTFQKELKFLSNTLVGDKLELKQVSKVAYFVELSQTDPKQHKLFFLMMPLWSEFKNVGDDQVTFIANPEILHDLTLKAVECLLIIDKNSEFTIQDKKEFLNDGYAVLSFGQWFLKEKFTGFFLNFITNYQALPITTTEQ